MIGTASESKKYIAGKEAVYTHTCAGCGREFTAYGNSKRKYCSHACYIKDRFGGGGADG